MAHIVVITGGMTGLFNACLALMQKLQNAGHRITYACPGAEPERLKLLNIPFVTLPPWEKPREKGAMSRWERVRRVRDRQRQAVADLQMDRVTDALKQLNPDLVLIDIEMHPHIMTAVRAGYSVALLCPFISIFNQANLPPIHTRIVPGKGWRGQWWGVQWSWLRYGWQKWTAFERDRLQKVGCDYISILRCYAKEINYPFISRFGFRNWLVPYPHRSIPILCLHAKELDFPHPATARMQYLGPMVFEESTDDSVAVLQEKEQPLIYCGLSSFMPARQVFLRRLSAIASQHPNWQFIIGLGGTPYPDSLPPLPNNVQALLWAPQLKTLKQADCAIINSGAHSITECIHCAVPMLIVPLGVNDQNGNASRVAYHGIGLIHNASDFSSEQAAQNQMLNSLQKLLEERSYKVQIPEMKQQFQRYDQENIAVNTIEQLLPSHSQSLQHSPQEVLS